MTTTRGRPRVDWTTVDSRAAEFADDRALCAALFGRIEPGLRDELLEDLRQGRATRTLVRVLSRFTPGDQRAALKRLRPPVTARQAKRWVEVRRNPVTPEAAARRVVRLVRQEFGALSIESATLACQRAAQLFSARDFAGFPRK